MIYISILAFQNNGGILFMDLKLALCSGSFSDDINVGRISILDVVDIAGKYGFDAVEIREDLYRNRDEDLKSIKQKASILNLKLIYSYMNRVLYKKPVTTKENCEMIKSRIDEAMFLCCPFIKVGFGEFNHYDEISSEHLKYVHDLVNYAEKSMVIICVENSDRVLGGNPNGIKQLVEKIDSPYLRITYDCGNYAILGHDPVATLNLIIKNVAYVHIKDYKKGEQKCTFLGSGEIDFAAIVNILKKIGYDGYFCFEFKMSIDNLDEIEKSLIFIKNLI